MPLAFSLALSLALPLAQTRGTFPPSPQSQPRIKPPSPGHSGRSLARRAKGAPTCRRSLATKAFIGIYFARTPQSREPHENHSASHGLHSRASLSFKEASLGTHPTWKKIVPNIQIHVSTRTKISLLLLLMNSPALTLAFSILLASALTSLGAEPKLMPLFNGKDLTHFKAEGASEFWSVDKGVLIGQNNAAQKGHYLWTEKEYGDFVIEFDVRWKGTTARGVDTGLEMRKPHLQLQLGISGSLRVDMSGSFYTGGKPAYPEAGQAKDAKKIMKPEGEWNTFRIQAKGNTFTCWINGVKASEYTDAKFAGAAPLGLQIHGGVVMKCEYRNMKIAEL